jgi:predicted RNA-binding Zn ribbon-like protein
LQLDSYADTGVVVAVDLVNRLVVRPEPATEAVLAEILAVDPPSAARLDAAAVAGFGVLATELERVFRELAGDDQDAAADLLNRMLAAHPAHPHLAKEDGRWRLHHHPADTELVPMWHAICAEALARLVGSGHGDRVGGCADPACRRVFVDVSRNGSRRFCSTTCQNRVKTAALRRRRGAAGAG